MISSDTLPRRIEFFADLPPKLCSPNSRCHWSARAKEIKTYRKDCCYLCRLAMGSFRLSFCKATIDTTWYMDKSVKDNRYRPRDFDNAVASLKALQDGIVDSGLLKSDSHLILEIKPPRFTTARYYDGARATGRSGILVTVTEVEELNG